MDILRRIIGSLLIPLLTCRIVPVAAQDTDDRGLWLGTSELLWLGAAGVVLVTWIVWRTRTRKRWEARAVSRGKAELATTVLHNIGNILNSLQISCDQSERILRAARLEQMGKAITMIDDHREDLGTYLTEDSRGKLIPEYLAGAVTVLREEVEEVLTELNEMSGKIHLMKDIIEAQQSHAKQMRNDERHDLGAIVKNALDIQSEHLHRRHIEVRTVLHHTEPIRAPKSQVMHVLINLIKNAGEALETVTDRDRLLEIESTQRGNSVELTIADNGHGIDETVLKKIFSYGYTTKEEGHGFGLHFCRTAMSEIKGSIRAESGGAGKGSRFTLTFPTA